MLFSQNDDKDILYLTSLDYIYKNSNWIEREMSEMFGLLFYWKADTRKLLLEYSKVEYPMLKDFPAEGTQEIFYNFFENQVYEESGEMVEL